MSIEVGSYFMKIQFNRFRLRTVSVVSALSMLTQLAWGVEPFAVRDIRIEGLQRVEPGTVFASLPLRVGDTYSDDKGTAAIRALFGLGLFKDVRIDVQDGVLVVAATSTGGPALPSMTPVLRTSSTFFSSHAAGSCFTICSIYWVETANELAASVP